MREHPFYERDVHSVTANTREDGQLPLAEAVRINGTGVLIVAG